MSPETALQQIKKLFFDNFEENHEYIRELQFYSRLFNPEFFNLPENEIRSDGYVVHTLEAAIWCLGNTSSFKDAVLKAVNLGDDTDTVGSITGTMAGYCIRLRDTCPNIWMPYQLNGWIQLQEKRILTIFYPGSSIFVQRRRLKRSMESNCKNFGFALEFFYLSLKNIIGAKMRLCLMGKHGDGSAASFQ
nr:ADP-ribosylglycohydrolase family protein [Metabacillus flavus]